MAAFLGIRRIREQQTHTGRAGDLTEPGQVGAASVHRREVEFEVARVHDDSLGGVEDDGVRLGHRVGHRQELDVEGPDPHALAVGHLAQRRLLQQAGLLDAVARETERDGRTVDGEGTLAQQELQASHVVLVAVSGHAPDDAVLVLDEVGEVGQNEVDAVHVRVREHETAVDDEQASLLFHHQAVAADLPETTEEDETNG